MPRSVSPALIISSAASSESDAALTPCTGPSCRSRATRLRSASIAAFVRRSRRVRSSSRSWRNWKSERIVWSATFAADTSRTSTSLRGGLGGHLRDPGLQVERLAFAPLDLRLSAGGEGGEAGVGAADRRRQGRPRFAFDRLAREPHHVAERTVRADHQAPIVELHDAVHGGVEHEPEVLLGSRAGSRSLRGRARAPRRLRRARPPSPPSASAVAWCAWVLAIWFDRMRAATPTPSRPMISTDCTPSIPRAASSAATTARAAQAATTEMLVSTGRAHRPGSCSMLALCPGE